jgi:hypothetical protein
LSFHLTQKSHAEMLHMAGAAVASISGARLRIKTHPRTRGLQTFHRLIQAFPSLDVRLVGRRSMDDLLAEATCVLSCASSAGIEATLTGRPVIQLLPASSEDLLPSHAWGLAGTARCQEELERLIGAALDGRSYLQPAASRLQPRSAAPLPAFGHPLPEGEGLESAIHSVFGDVRRPAAVQIVDALLDGATRSASPVVVGRQRAPSIAVPASSSN